MAEIRHLEKNRHDVIFLPWTVRFGQNFEDWCRMMLTAVI